MTRVWCGRLADGALDLLVILVADEDDLEVAGGEAPRLGVDLGHERAGGVDDVELGVRRRASRTAGDTPWAEKITVAPGGTSSTSSTNTAPRRSSSATTCALWTICLRT